LSCCTALAAIRPALLGQLEALEAGAEFRQERARRRRLAENLDQVKAALRARTVAIPSPQATGLPKGAHLRPGELHIRFNGTEDLLRQLFELALAIQHDYAGFQKICGGSSAVSSD
jgi:hypothetical protein